VKLYSSLASPGSTLESVAEYGGYSGDYVGRRRFLLTVMIG
jgi:hypothetical protein